MSWVDDFIFFFFKDNIISIFCLKQLFNIGITGKWVYWRQYLREWSAFQGLLYSYARPGCSSQSLASTFTFHSESHHLCAERGNNPRKSLDDRDWRQALTSRCWQLKDGLTHCPCRFPKHFSVDSPWVRKHRNFIYAVRRACIATIITIKLTWLENYVLNVDPFNHIVHQLAHCFIKNHLENQTWFPGSHETLKWHH